MGDSVRERLARIEAESQATRREIHAIFELHNNKVVPAMGQINSLEPRVQNLESVVKDHESGHWKPYVAIAAFMTAMGSFMAFGQKIGTFFRGMFHGS